MIKHRRLIQFFFLLLFFVLLGLATIGATVSADFFLRLDPAIITVTAIATRNVSVAMLSAVVVLLVTLVFGRLFCSHLCPMGTAIDLTDHFLKPKDYKFNLPESLHYYKYYMLFFLIGAALLGVSFVFWTSPISLVTRFYGLVLYPGLMHIVDQIIKISYPMTNYFDFRNLMFLGIKTPRFDTQYFILVFFILVFAAAKLSPRFWCRYLCPAGGILALFSQKPIFRRHVNENCVACGLCDKKCPMDAIDSKNQQSTTHSACIVCRSCEAICPKNAITFSPKRKSLYKSSPKIEFARRQFLISGLTGMGTAVVTLTGIKTVTGIASEGQLKTPQLIRPPAALPEHQFLTRCIRCGECMVVCPTNTLQPIWFQAGTLAAFSPAIIPRLKYCDPRCHRCAEVCPTGAIKTLSAAERIWAKTGTATISRRKCLAWEFNKSCMVCDEVCPFNALEFKIEKDLPFPVPRVNEDKCAGCGYCEHFCPVQNVPAIQVTPMNAIRLDKGSYEREGKIRGLNLHVKTIESKTKVDAYPYDPKKTSVPDLAPGFDNGFESDE